MSPSREADGDAPLLFCATGVRRTVGGIAASNRNVLAALEQVGHVSGRPVRSLILNEPSERTGTVRSFGGNKVGFALAVATAAPTSALVVFDHVRLALPVLALPRALRPPVVICAHGSESWWRIRPTSIRAFQAANLVLTNSRYTLGRMRDRFSEFQGVACPLGLAPEVVMSASPPEWLEETVQLTAADGTQRRLGRQLLLIVSRLDASEREKGHRELIAVLPRIARRFPDAQLVIAGSGSDLEALRALAAASSVSDRLFLPGYVADDLRERLYRKAFAYVMPSRQEGFGLAYLEAMNYAKACLACRDDGGGEVVVHDETGVLIPREFSEDDLLSAIEGLLEDPERTRRFGERGWARLHETFTSSAHQDRMVRILQPLVRG